MSFIIKMSNLHEQHHLLRESEWKKELFPETIVAFQIEQSRTAFRKLIQITKFNKIEMNAAAFGLHWFSRMGTL